MKIFSNNRRLATLHSFPNSLLVSRTYCVKMNSAKRSFQVAQSCVRQIATAQTQKAGAAANVPIGYSKLKIKQEKFQVKDGQLVFLKGGMLDKVMYQGTMALSLLGVGLVCKLIYDLAVPAKPE